MTQYIFIKQNLKYVNPFKSDLQKKDLLVLGRVPIKLGTLVLGKVGFKY